MENKKLEKHLFDPGPKRILALDGGGIRGVLTLGYLKKIEDILRTRCKGGPDFRLSDYFDLIGGTSTGSIIACGLALGFSVEKLQNMYRSLSREVFKKPLLRLGILSAKFPEEPLLAALNENFGNIVLGGNELMTGLAVVTKRLDTGSPWILHNNPRGKYFNPPENDPGATPNRDFPLTQIMRASTSAPHFFDPELLHIAKGMDGAFVDGGMSPHNNPSLQMLLLATLKGHGFSWPTGEKNLLLVSAGTGNPSPRLTADTVMKMPAIQVAGQSLISLINDCDWLGQTVLQWLSDSPTAFEIDSEIGDLDRDVLDGKRHLSYLRYNVVLNAGWIRKHLNMKMDGEKLQGLSAMDNPDNLEQLERLGAAAAEIQIKEHHFPAAFDK